MALMQPVPAADAIAAHSCSVNTGQQLDPDALARWLGEHGFQRCDAVEVPGDFARRGGIVDVFSNAHTDPVRIEFFGDEIESLRTFDPLTQRSEGRLNVFDIAPAHEALTRLAPTVTAKQRSGMRARGKKRERAQAMENDVAACPEGKETAGRAGPEADHYLTVLLSGVRPWMRTSRRSPD
jgi:transcription-repair coupling factor (superfamily II helicase)